MAHFAEIDQNGIVQRVIVADQAFIDSGAVGNPANWIETSYNTVRGENKKGGAPMRKNYAGIGMKYDKDRDAFIPTKPYESWVLDEQTCMWKAPKEHPNNADEPLEWDEQKKDWVPEKPKHK